MNQPDVQPVIVGLSCRVPGARSLSATWDILASQTCTVTQADTRLFDPAFYFDPHRPRKGKSYTFAAGQLAALYDFDADFFGLSPRAATEMDPQQRLMLQSVWEAVEDSGGDIADLAGERTGVFVGASLVEMLPKYYMDPARGGSNFILGNTLSIIANRVSSTFNFAGPSFVLDTACSSGLYALHQAREAICSGQIDTAIVGGVHVVRTPGGFIGFSQARMLSPTGLCRAFDAAADGYVRSEACVTVVLMHPDKAQALNLRHRARLRATGVNSDGAAKQLTVPSVQRQDTLLTQVLEHAHKDPEDLDFYEAHGTGTQVGDLAEATGLGEALATLRRMPLLIGSAKTNFGHSEPASGLVGLAKVLLAMQHRTLPASLHFDTPNPAIDFEALNLQVADTTQPLPENGTLCAGINSFGFGGTNVAAIVESIHPPAVAKRAKPPAVEPPWLLLSAESEASLDKLSALWSQTLETKPKTQWPDLAQAASRRTSLKYRCAIPLTDQAPTLLRQLGSDALIFGKVAAKGARTVFAFPGNGAQHRDMGRTAYAINTTYRAAFDACATAFAKAGIPDLTGYLNAPDLDDQLASPLVVQPLLFACQIAQARTLIDMGVQPDATIGHSLGEIAALHIAGAFSLADAAKIVARRSARFERLRAQGGMITVATSKANIEQVLGGFDASLGLAAVNSPNSVTVSGPTAMLERFAKATLNGKRMAMVRLGVEVAYHSAGLAPLEADFHDDLTDIDFHPLQIPVAGAAVGRMLRTNEVDAQYLWRNARDTVQFHDALTALASTQANLLLEIAPKSVLAANIRDTAGFAGLALDHYAPKEPRENTASSVAACWVHGANIEKSRIAGGPCETPVALPTYPWNEQEYFAPLSPDGFDALGEFSTKALAGRRIDRTAPIWIAEFTPTQPAWVADHIVGTQTILPATALLEIALSAGAALWPDATLDLTDFDILQPAELGTDGIRIRTTLDENTHAATLCMRPRLSDANWVTLARATLRPTTATITSTWPRQLAWTGRPADIYDTLSAAGLDYGPRFQRLEDMASLSKTRFRCRLNDDEHKDNFCLDPMGLDAVFHGLAALGSATKSPLAQALQAGAVLVPNRVARLRWTKPGAPIRYACLDVTARRARSLAADVVLFDETGQAVAELQGVEFALIQVGQAQKTDRAHWTRIRPKWRAPNAPVKWPRGWRKPHKTLERLGLSSQRPTLQSRALFASLHNGLAAQETLGTTLRTLLDQAPDLADDARVHMARAHGQPNYAVVQNTASQRALWHTADQIIRAICTSWHPQERLNLAVLGLTDPVTVQNWTLRAEIDDVFLSSPIAEQHDYLEVTLPEALLGRLRREIAPGQADVILAVGEAAQTKNLDTIAAPDAMVLRLDAPDLAPHEPEDTGWFATRNNIAVQLRIDQSGTPRSAAQRHLSNLGRDPIPIPALSRSEAPHGLPTLVHQHAPNDTGHSSLSRLLMRLKSLKLSPKTRTLLLVVNEGGANFSALARAAGSVLRSLGNERPDWDMSVIAIDTAPPETLWPALLEASQSEPLLYVQGRDIRTERADYTRRPPPQARNTALALPLVARQRLSWQAAPRSAPAPDDVEIEVAATGLNFRDVLWAQGRLPDRLFDLGASPPSMGMECAGIVSRAGANAEIAVGQPVMAFAPEAFRRYLTLPAASVVPTPTGLTLEAAAAIPVAFATAWESLHLIAKLSKGESILIHGAAGGVGMAAMQIAQALGARIFATAGSPEKRAFVQAMGAQEVFDSRDLRFADGVLQATNGRGVDVVLNSLAGAAMEKSVACLAPFGRFVELGKRDFLESTRLDLRPFLRNLSYFAYDLDQRLAADPDGVRTTMSTLTKAFKTGTLKPLPVTQFAADAVDDALRHMQAARHVGKIVVTPAPPHPQRKSHKISGTWVLIGGTGGVGLALAKALHTAGAQTIHLVSRSADLPLGSGPEGAWALDAPNVHFHSVDASSPENLAAFLCRIGPVEGVVHAAMTLRDRLLKDLDAQETIAVIRSKLGVAETLDTVLRAQDISPTHVLFLSSVAAFLGNPGQIAYAAANAAMEAIAEGRRQDGLAGTVLALGPIHDRGVLARDTAKSRPIARLEGIDFLSIQQCTAEIVQTLRRPHAQDCLFAPLDWRAMARILPALAAPGFDRVVSEAARNQKTVRDLTQAVKTMEWPAALKLVISELSEALCSILKLPADQFEPLRPLSRYGIDSLMAMELRLEIEQRFGFAMPVASLTETATTADLSVALLKKLREDQT